MNPETDNLPLRDIHLPMDISWWPLAIGWWLLLLIALSAVLFLILRRKKKSHQLSKVAAMREYNQVVSNFRNSANKVYLLRELSVVLRRISISFYPQHNVASLTGTAWLAFLDSVLPPSDTDKTGRFQSDTGRLLITAPYIKKSRQQEIDTEQLLNLCHHWIDNLPNSVEKNEADRKRSFSALLAVRKS